MNEPIKYSPIPRVGDKGQVQLIEQAGWQVAARYRSIGEETAVIHQAVGLCDQSHNGKIRVEGMAAGQLLAADELAINGGKQTTFGRIYRLRRDLFFVTTAPDTVEEVAASLADQAANAESLITVTDVTHGNAELWLVGPQAAALLSRLCGLDFHDSRFPNGTAKRSSVAKTAQIIIRRDMVGKQTVPAYTLIGARSFAAYLWQTILAAGRDLSVQPVGQAALIPA